MNVVDSSAWLEYFAGAPSADFFAPAIEATSELVVPTLVLYEVFKRVLQQRGEGDAKEAIAQLQRGEIVELSSELALESASISAALGIPMADSIILATTRKKRAVLWTQDADFEGIEGVQYRKKSR